MAKKPIIVQSRFAPKSYCINLFGTFWARDISWIDRKVINHERIHTAQMKELLYIPFYIIYVLEWLVLLIRLRDSRKAYRAISFEREAYDNAHDYQYLARRRHYSQWRKH